MSRLTTHIVDTKRTVKIMLDDLQDLPQSSVSLFVDLEGVQLSRHGTVSILQMYNRSKSKVYLIDVHSLGASAFEINSYGITLRSVLESKTIAKGFFDCRNDSDALYAHFGIVLDGIVDIQLLELASRPRGCSKAYLTGLAKLILRDCVLSAEERNTSYRIKDQGRALFAPERGGAYEVFNERPLQKAIIEYCVQDVTALPELHDLYYSRLTDGWLDLVEKATDQRLEESRSEHYLPNGPRKCMGPWQENPYWWALD